MNSIETVDCIHPFTIMEKTKKKEDDCSKDIGEKMGSILMSPIEFRSI